MGLIYEHWRLDTNECFYIGKADGKDPYGRAHNLKARNPHHGHIVAMLNPLGLIQVRASEFPEITKSALNNLEILSIAHHKMYVGKRLTNKAKGGDGGDTWSSLSKEDKDKAIAKRLESIDMVETGKKISAGWHAKPQEEKDIAHAKKAANTDYEARNVKRKETIALMPQEKLDAWSAKRIENTDWVEVGRKISSCYHSKSEEEKKEKAKKTKDGHARRTLEQKAETERQRQDTLRKRNEERKAAGLPTSQEKRKATIALKSEEEKAKEKANRQAGARARVAQEPKEKRTARALKTWETRRRNKAEALAAKEKSNAHG